MARLKDHGELEVGLSWWSLAWLPYRFELFTSCTPTFGLDDGLWRELTTPGGPAYHHLWAPLLAFELAGNALIILVGFIALLLLLRESKYTPTFAIAWLGLMAGIVALDYFISDLIPAVAEQADTESLKELWRSATFAAVWIPYFLVSKRVRATFVK